MLCPSCKAENDESAENCFKCGKGLFVLIEGSVLASRYEILSPLGKGGMGMVYKAHDRELDELVAIKVVRAEAASSPEMTKRFRSEIKLARRVSHPNVCRIHELGREGPLRYIVMEYVEGADFKRILRERGRLAPPEAYEVAEQIADALQAIHNEGIIHRDLKTTNVMRNARGVVKLMDFGIAKSFEAGITGLTVTGHIVGTPEYMSPEQAQGDKVDMRSDIYALGIVTFELFTGNVPFHSDTPLATLFKQIHDPPPLEGTRDLPRALVPALRRALAKEPNERFQSAREFGGALRLARGQPLPSVTRPSTEGPTRSAVVPVEMPETTPLPTPVRTAVPTEVRSPVWAAAPHEGADAARPLRPHPPPDARPRTRSGRILAGTTAALALLVGGGLLWMNRGEPREGAVAESATAPPATDHARVTVPTAAPEPPVVAPLEAPLPLAPPEQAEVSYGDPARAATLLSWKPGSGAASYHVMLDRGQGFTQPLVDRRVAGDTTLQLQGLSAGKYYWRVAAVAADGREGSFSAAREFTITRSSAAVRVPTAPSPVARNQPLPAPTPQPPLAEPTAPATPAATPPTTSSPSEPAAQSGTLQLLIVPWAEVEVDGVKVGISPPLKPLSLAAGVHAIKLTHPDYLPFPRKVSIRPGETTRLQVDLTKEAFPK